MRIPCPLSRNFDLLAQFPRNVGKAPLLREVELALLARVKYQRPDIHPELLLLDVFEQTLAFKEVFRRCG